MSYETFVYWPEAAYEHDSVSESPDLWSVSSIVAYDSQNDDVKYGAVVQFVRDDDKGLCFMFALSNCDDREGLDFIVDSRRACEIIPAWYRADVLSALLRNVRELLKLYAPSEFIMWTFLPHLKARQLEKYARLLEIFREHGYVGEPATEDEDGYITWRLTLAR